MVQYAVGQGFYVTIDFHFEQQTLQSDPAKFSSEWSRMWRDLAALPAYSKYLAGRVFPELANEWDKFGCKWEVAGGTCGWCSDASVASCSWGMVPGPVPSPSSTHHQFTGGR